MYLGVFDQDQLHRIQGEAKKKLTRFAGNGIKNMRAIFKTKMLIYQSKINLDERVLFAKITHL